MITKEKIILRGGLKRYPKEPYAIFELPVRKNNKKYQVWTGKKWYQLEIIHLK